MTIQFDPEHLIDPRWRLERLYEIVDKRGRRVPFVPNAAQVQLLDALHGRDVIPKARQIGVTTLFCLLSLDEVLFTPDWRVGIIAHTLDAAKEIFRDKVRAPYDRLPEAIRARVPLVRDSADTLELANGSSIRVAVSHRSGTLNRLHVSEFGKICARYPDRAREIVTGSFPATEHGDITVESTAEGQEGAFYGIVQRASTTPHSLRDWKLHFLPWWQDAAYVADPAQVVISDLDQQYFERLEVEDGIKLSPHQRAWYVITEREQGGDMKREYPSTLREAFEQAIEGAYFEHQLAHATKQGLIGRFPPEPAYPVHSFWDLGRNDFTAIWLAQEIRGRYRIVGYYENSGEHIGHYINWLRGWLKERGLSEGDAYWPHDGKREDLFLAEGRLGVAAELGLRPMVVERVQNKLEAIEAARTIFPRCDWDERGAKKGLERLRHYRKEWDELRETWRDRPRHDDASHAADAFMTLATGYLPQRKEQKADEPDFTAYGSGGWML